MLTSSPHLSRPTTTPPQALYYGASTAASRSPHIAPVAPACRHSSTKSSISPSTITPNTPITQTSSTSATTATAYGATPASSMNASSVPIFAQSTLSTLASETPTHTVPPSGPHGHSYQPHQCTMQHPGSSTSHTATIAELTSTSPLSVSIATTPSATMSPGVVEDRMTAQSTASPCGVGPGTPSTITRPTFSPQKQPQLGRTKNSSLSPQKRRGSSSIEGPPDNKSTSLISQAQPIDEPRASPKNIPAKRVRHNSTPVKVLPIHYEMCQVEDLVVLIAHMLSELIETNDSLALRGSGSLTRFHSRTSPGISVRDYLNRLAKHATLTPPLLLSMVYYIDRLCTLYPDFTINTLTVHRFLITAATVAAKGLSDSFWNNTTYARVGGVRVAELKMLELEFLYRVDWKIVPNPEVLVAYYTGLVERCPGFDLEQEKDQGHEEDGQDEELVVAEAESEISDDATGTIPNVVATAIVSEDSRLMEAPAQSSISEERGFNPATS
ncbi:Nuc-1 negative regulatory protein preg [Ceratocystis lukuohia]|uniref:Nuc-1 negative regulatory protein preg n=1 Tax=Ceratocystis lukuohia TaxID=2019550 RepID=A0ABR4MSF7_9PEZI